MWNLIEILGQELSVSWTLMRLEQGGLWMKRIGESQGTAAHNLCSDAPLVTSFSSLHGHFFLSCCHSLNTFQKSQFKH